MVRLKETPEKVAEELAARLKSQREGPVRGQVKGPFFDGPATVVVCPICTGMFGGEEHRPVGVLRKHQKSHMANHKAGRIVRVS